MSLRSGENPAAWRGHLALILPKRGKAHARPSCGDALSVTCRNSSRKLREAESISALALEFLILTAGRAGEVLRASWDEIDIDAQVWVVPDSRMKAGREHRVPLSPRALAILERVAEIRTGDLVFAGQRRGGHYPARRLPRSYRARRFMDSDRPSGIGRAKKQVSRARSPSRRWRTRLAMRSSRLTVAAMR